MYLPFWIQSPNASHADRNQLLIPGLYYIFLRDWLAVIPRPQLHVLSLEDYREDRESQLQDIARFLQIGIQHGHL